MAVWVPPHRPVDVDVLDKQGNQQVKKKQELKQQAAVRGQLGNPRVTDRLRSDEGRKRRGRQTHRVTAPERTRATQMKTETLKNRYIWDTE